MKRIFLSALILLFFCSIAFTEDITLKTYYPSPFGTYSRLRLVPQNVAPAGVCDEGTMYVDQANGLQYCEGGAWGSVGGAWEEQNNNVYPMNTPNVQVGIGTSTPSVLLHISDDNPTLRLQDSGGWPVGNRSTLDITSTNGDSSIGTTTNTGLRILTRTNERMSLGSNGQMVIQAADGGATPTLAVQGDIQAQANMEILGDMDVQGNVTGGLMMGQADGSNSYAAFHSDNPDLVYTIGYYNDPSPFIPGMLVISAGKNPFENPILTLDDTGNLTIKGNLQVGDAPGEGDLKVVETGAGAEKGYYATYAP